MKNLIIAKINEVLQQTDRSEQYEDIEDSAILLETGLDSLGFAILVSLLEEELDLDPFQLMDEPVYPITFGDFLSIYEKYSD
jgi:aryl carrier-like protein